MPHSLFLIGEQSLHPTAIRSQHEQEELRKLRMNLKDVHPAADLLRSDARETKRVSHTPRRIKQRFNHTAPSFPLWGEGGGVLERGRTSVNLWTVSEAGATFQRDKYFVVSP